MRDPECVVRKIIAGEIPGEIVEQDEKTVAFMDTNPGTRGHLLVVPREHARDLLEIGEEDLAATISTAKRMASGCMIASAPAG